MDIINAAVAHAADFQRRKHEEHLAEQEAQRLKHAIENNEKANYATKKFHEWDAQVFGWMTPDMWKHRGYRHIRLTIEGLPGHIDYTYAYSYGSWVFTYNNGNEHADTFFTWDRLSELIVKATKPNP